MWKKYNDHYDVSNKGQVFSKKRGKILIGDTNSKGYHRVMMDNKRFFIHRLVAILFIPNPFNLPQVNHIDYNTMNNSIDNLEWVTHIQNIHHSYKNGRKSGGTKISKQDLIILLSEIGSISNEELAKKYKVTIHTIYSINKGRGIKRLLL